MPGELDRAFATDDVCPKCLGELDTGWECNSCGYDARPSALSVESLEDAIARMDEADPNDVDSEEYARLLAELVRRRESA
jgi:hypothetical protein